jgi:hypothetical protein
VSAKESKPGFASSLEPHSGFVDPFGMHLKYTWLQIQRSLGLSIQPGKMHQKQHLRREKVIAILDEILVWAHHRVGEDDSARELISFVKIT